MVAGGILFLRHAPAVNFALFGGLAGGLAGFFVSVADGPRGVPTDVTAWASWSLVVSGVVGLLATRGRPPAKFLRRAAVGFLSLGPVVGGSVAVLLVHTCPLYVTRHAGFCYYSVDVLGGWITEVTMFLVFDAVVLAVLSLTSARQARASSPARG